jgi:transglutaminase-like putative cysteine protease
VQKGLSHNLQIIPQPSVLTRRTDYFGNTVTQFSFNQGYDALTVTAIDEVEVMDSAPLTKDPAWDLIAQQVHRHETFADLAAYEFRFDSPRCRISSGFREYAGRSFEPGRPIVAACDDLLKRFKADFQFDSHATTVSTPVEEAFQQRRGVCQDFAHLMISMLRSVGLSARYVSGYLRTLPPPGKPRIVGGDESHAWASVYAGDLGWIDLDPAIGKRPTADHMTVAYGRDYGDVAPLKGVYIGGGTHQLTVSVDVADLPESGPDAAETNGTRAAQAPATSAGT